MAGSAKKASKKKAKTGKSVPKKPSTGKRGGARPGAGRPPFRPTDDQRRQVEELAGLGLSQHEIALVIYNPDRDGAPISEVTLRKHFAHELAVGAPRANAEVARRLYKKATSDDHPQAATCAIWWTKARMGWKSEERHQIDVESKSGVLVVPATVTPEQWVADQQTKNREKQSPEGEG